MNLIELQRKLLAAARATAPADRVPYAFEKRIMAHLAAQPRLDTLALWARALWRAAIPCVAAVLLLSATSLFVPQGAVPAAGETLAANNTTTELSDEFENTLLADVSQNASDEDVW